MSYAYKKGSGKWVKHDERSVWTMRLDPSGRVTNGGLDLTELLRNEDYEEHGWWMWSAWYLVGLLLLSRRYAKKHWTFVFYMHAFLGYFVLIVTVVFALRVIKWDFSDIHNILGIVTLFVTVVGGLSGPATAGTMKMYNGDKPWAERERVERVAKFHRMAGYTMLFLGNVTAMTGIGHYFGDILQGDNRKILGVISLLSFCFIVMVLEAIYRLRNKYAKGHITTPEPSELGKVQAFSPEEIDLQVKAGKELVIFDNLVLNLNGYTRLHPGGKFNLTHNFGRDVSKFFFGGYNLVQVRGKRPYHHSQSALEIVKTMVVGVIEGQN